MKRRGWAGATVAFVIFTAAVVQTFTQEPVYEAKARILIEADRGNPAGLKDPVDETQSSITDFQTQLMILRSRSLARETMQALGLWTTIPVPAPSRPTPGSFKAFLADIRNAAVNVGSRFGRDAKFAAASSEPALTEANLDTVRIDTFLNRLRVTPIPNTRLIDVYYTSPDPQQAAQSVNSLVANFIRKHAEARVTASEEVVGWLNARLVEQRAALEASEAALQQYRLEHNIVPVGADASLAVQRLTALTAVVTKAKTDRIEKEALVKQLQAMRNDSAALESFPTVLADPVVQRLRAEVSTQQQKQVEIAEKYGERHPTLIKAREQLAAAEGRLRAEVGKVVGAVQSEFEAARATEVSLSQTLEAHKRETLAQNGNDVELLLLQREAESNRQIWQNLQQRVNEVAVTRERRTTNVRVVDNAEVPQAPIGDEIFKALRFSAAVAVLIGLTVAFGLERFDNRVKTPEEIRLELGIPFLGLVPLIGKVDPKGPAPPLVADSSAPPSATGTPAGFGEAFRKLRTSIRLSLPEDGVQRLLVTSARMGEGKTLIASNLAITLAYANQRVLLIDADLRRPRLHKVFKLPQEPGLSNLIVGQTSASAAIRKTAIRNLRVLPSGTLPPNPSELLEAKRFKELMASLGQYFDWVIIDSPPLLPVTDALVLTKQVNGVILVLAADSTPLQVARTAIDLLGTADAGLIGAALNRVDLERRAYYYLDYYREEDEQYYNRSSATA